MCVYVCVYVFMYLYGSGRVQSINETVSGFRSMKDAEYLSPRWLPARWLRHEKVVWRSVADARERSTSGTHREEKENFIGKWSVTHTGKREAVHLGPPPMTRPSKPNDPIVGNKV